MSAEAFLIDPAGSRRPIHDGMTIGRQGCDLTIADDEASRRHARVRLLPGGRVVVEDMSSRNGTFVNEQRISAATALSEGDSLRTGRTIWTLRVSGGRKAEAAPAAARAGQGAARGDVPPPGATPSAVRQRAAVLVGEPAFPEAARSRAPVRGSAARIDAATFISFAVVLATAISVIAYLAAR